MATPQKINNSLKNVRSSYEKSVGANVGPTADNTSRIAMLKKIQTRVSYSDGSNAKFSQLWGLNNVDKDGNTKGNKSGVTGDSGTRTYFSGIFPRMTF